MPDTRHPNPRAHLPDGPGRVLASCPPSRLAGGLQRRRLPAKDGGLSREARGQEGTRPEADPQAFLREPRPSGKTRPRPPASGARDAGPDPASRPSIPSEAPAPCREPHPTPGAHRSQPPSLLGLPAPPAAGAASPAPTARGGGGFLWHPFPRTHLAHWQPICPEAAADTSMHSGAGADAEAAVSAASSRRGAHTARLAGLGPWCEARPGAAQLPSQPTGLGPGRQGGSRRLGGSRGRILQLPGSPKWGVLLRAPTGPLPTGTPGSAMLLGHLQARGRPRASSTHRPPPRPLGQPIPGSLRSVSRLSRFLTTKSRGAWGWPPGGGATVAGPPGPWTTDSFQAASPAKGLVSMAAA